MIEQATVPTMVAGTGCEVARWRGHPLVQALIRREAGWLAASHGEAIPGSAPSSLLAPPAGRASGRRREDGKREEGVRRSGTDTGGEDAAGLPKEG